MVELFQSTKQNVSLHINTIFKEGELDEYSTVKEYLTVQEERFGKAKRIVMGGFLAGFLVVLGLIVRRVLKQIV